jgi:hypothetical protein
MLLRYDLCSQVVLNICLLPDVCFTPVRTQLIEDEEARNAILENIPPKRAAQLLLLMQELAAELVARRRQVERQLAEEQVGAWVGRELGREERVE